MAKMTTPEKLSADINAITAEWAAGELKGVDEAMKKLANKGRNAVRKTARSIISTKGRRKYTNGWMYKMVTGSNKWAAGAVIYQKKQPGIAHLLEFGHATVNGGRTNPREHIKPVADQIANEALAAFKKEL